MAENEQLVKRVVTAPSTAGPFGSGQVLSVEAGPDEDVEWVWTHDRQHGSFVTGYRIVPRRNQLEIRP
jgi:hypothetical protein